MYSCGKPKRVLQVDTVYQKQMHYQTHHQREEAFCLLVWFVGAHDGTAAAFHKSLTEEMLHGYYAGLVPLPLSPL